MKLVEILAREMMEWVYDYDYICQCVDRDLVALMNNTSKSRYLGIHPEMAEDQATAKVTRTQWQAERERIIGMDTQQATASVAPTYEQQLWDRVAAGALPAVICAEYTMATPEQVAKYAIEYADALMAERAKRLHKQD